MTFDQHHHQLDYTVLGATAEMENAVALLMSHGSVVVCGSFEAMRTWTLKEYREEPTDIDPVFYGEMIAAVSNEGISLHMDAAATAQFMSLLASDQRFRPEILFYEEDGWTAFTSAFDPIRDPRKNLQEELDAFVIGYLDMGKDDNSFVVRGQKMECKDRASSPLRFIDYRRLDIPVERLDEIALARLESMCPWIAMIDTDSD
jgi:hypothetical protein